MSEDTEQVGNSDSDGDSQSSKEGSQQSPDLATVLKKLEGLENQFKGLQKGTDKVNSRVEKRVEEILSSGKIGRIADLAKAGKTSEEIENQLLLEDLLAERKGKASGANLKGNEERAGGGPEAQPDIFTETVKALNLDVNDKNVAEAIAKKDYSGLVKLGASKLAVPEPDASTQPLVSHKESVSPDANQKALQTSFEKEVLELRKSGFWSPGKVAELKLQYRKKGLNIN